MTDRLHTFDDIAPAWEANYEPGNVSDYLIGYANTEAAAKGAALAWLQSQSDKDPNTLEWVEQPTDDQYDHWYGLIQNADDGMALDIGINVRHRLAAARPYACGNCEGIDPSSCIANPNRAARQTFPAGPCGCGAPATLDVVHRQGAPCYMDLDGSLQTVELPPAAARQATGQDDTEQRLAELEAEIARLHNEHKASLRRADQVNAQLMQEVQRYADGTERPVLWSVYNEMHSRALTAEAKLAAHPAVGQPAEAHDTDPWTPANLHFLRFALGCAAAVMYSEDDFTDEDHAALDQPRAFAGPSPEDQAFEARAAADAVEDER